MADSGENPPASDAASKAQVEKPAADANGSGVPAKDEAAKPEAAKPEAAKPEAAKPGGRGRGGPKKDMVPYRSLFRFATGVDNLMIAVGIVAGGIAGIIMPLFTVVFGGLLNAFQTANGLEQVNTYCLYFLIIAAVGGLCAFLEVALPMIAAERQMMKLRKAYLQALLRQPLAWYDTNRAGEVASRMAEDTVTIANGMGDKLSQTLHFSLTFIAGIVIAFTSSWAITLTLLVCVPPLVLVMAFLKQSTQRFEKDSSNGYARAGDAATEAISLIRSVAAYGGEETEVRRYDAHLEKSEVAGIAKGRAMAGAVGFMFALLFALYAAGMSVGARMIVNSRQDNPGCRFNPLGDGCFSGGTVIQAFMAALIASFSLGQVGPNFSSFAAAQAAAFSIFKVIDTVPDIDALEEERGVKPAAEAVRGKIEFKSVSFSYPSRKSETILKNFNLTINAGERLALVGSSGSGKSTIVQLIMRYYDVDEGEVLVDGINVKDWNVRALRDHIGYVDQQPVLFGVSVRENIAFGVPESAGPCTEEDIQAAAKAANAHDFITKLPKGYDTIVGTSVSSAQLSGGQRQRICIARAIIRNPKILALDEATSALDNASERVVQASIDALLAQTNTKSITSVIVAHRLSTIQTADRIVVMSKGSIVESGTHEQLMAIPDGVYQHLRSLQALSKEGQDKGVHSTASVTDLAAIEESATSAPAAAPVPAAAAKPGKDGETVVMVENSLYTHKAKAGKQTPQKEEEEEQKPVSASRVWRMQLPELPYIIVALLASAVAGSVQPIFSIAYSELIVYLFNPNDEVLLENSYKFCGYFVLIAVASGVATYLRISSFVHMGEKLTRRLRVMAFRAVLRQPISFFDAPGNSVGRLNTRLASDAALVRGATGETLGLVFQAYSSIITAVVIAFVASWRLALVCLSIMPLLVASGKHHNAAFKGYSMGAAKALEEAGHVVTESTMAIRVVSAFNLHGKMQSQFAKTLEIPSRNAVRKGLVAGSGQGFSQSILFAAYALSFYVGAIFIRDGDLTFQGLMRVFLAVTMASQAVGSASSWGPDSAKAQAAMRSIFSLIDRPSDIDPLNKENGKQLQATGKITFKNVSFAYPERPDQWVLRNFSLTIQPGETVALVGESGSGKSTIVALLERYYDPQEGEIFVDDVPLKSINVAAWRKNMALCSQEPALFADSLLYNIAYGRADSKPECDQGVPMDEQEKEKEREKEKEAAAADASKKKVASDEVAVNMDGDADVDAVKVNAMRFPPVPEDVLQAARDANAADFIAGFKHGYYTHAGSRGGQLSGGQRQRVAIARAIIRNPKILLLDESTSALDSTSEAVVQAALDRILTEANTQRTSIVIAHRLSTVRGADRICVMEKGELKEVGTHAQLVSQPGGLYRRLVDAQEHAPAAAAAEPSAPAAAT